MEKNGKEMKDIHKKALQLRGVYVKGFRRKRQKEERTLPNTLSHLQSLSFAQKEEMEARLSHPKTCLAKSPKYSQLPIHILIYIKMIWASACENADSGSRAPGWGPQVVSAAYLQANT